MDGWNRDGWSWNGIHIGCLFYAHTDSREKGEGGIKPLRKFYLEQSTSHQPANTCGCSGGGRSSFSTLSASIADEAAEVGPLAVAGVFCVSGGKLSRTLCTFCSTSSVQSMRSLSSWRAFSMTLSCLSPSPVRRSSRLWTWLRAALPEEQEEAPVACGQWGDAWPDM